MTKSLFEKRVQARVNMIKADEEWSNWDFDPDTRTATPIGAFARERIMFAAEAAARLRTQNWNDWEYNFDTRSGTRIGGMTKKEQFLADVESEAKARVEFWARIEPEDWALAQYQTQFQVQAQARSKSRLQRARRVRRAKAKARAKARAKANALLTQD